MDYNNMINVFNDRDEDGEQIFTFNNILVHSNQGISYEPQILCDTENKTWGSLTEINPKRFISVNVTTHNPNTSQCKKGRSGSGTGW